MEENGKNKHARTLHIYSSSDTAYLLNRPINKNGNLEKLTHAKRKLTQPVNHEWLFTCASQCTPYQNMLNYFSHACTLL